MVQIVTITKWTILEKVFKYVSIKPAVRLSARLTVDVAYLTYKMVLHIKTNSTIMVNLIVLEKVSGMLAKTYR